MFARVSASSPSRSTSTTSADTSAHSRVSQTSVLGPRTSAVRFRATKPVVTKSAPSARDAARTASCATCQFVRMRPSSLTNEPVPPRPEAPTDTRASLSAASALDVPSIFLASIFRPMSRSTGSSSPAAVMGQVRKRPMASAWPSAAAGAGAAVGSAATSAAGAAARAASSVGSAAMSAAASASSIAGAATTPPSGETRAFFFFLAPMDTLRVGVARRVGGRRPLAAASRPRRSTRVIRAARTGERG